MDFVTRSIRFPRDLYEQIEATAKAEERSFQGQVIYWLRKAAKAAEAEHE